MPGSNSDANQSVSPLEIVTSTKPKKGVKRIVAAVIIIIFLVVSVVAGVLLVGQNQNIQEKAKVTICPGAEACPYPKNRNLLLSCHPVDSDGTTTDSLCSWVGRVETCGSASTKYCCPAAGGFWTTDMTACTTPRPTPIPPQCLSVKAYNSQWTLLTAAQLKALKTGATINFCVAGSAVSGTFDKAQFKINTTLKSVTTDKRPGSNDYCQSYKILSTDKTVSVKAKIHHATLGWFGENI